MRNGCKRESKEWITQSVLKIQGTDLGIENEGVFERGYQKMRVIG